VHSAADESRNQHLQLSITDQRITADQGKMEWSQAIDNFKHTIDKSLTFSVVQTSKRDFATEVLIVICVAAGTPKRAFFGDFD